jgi:hypothetical protein
MHLLLATAERQVPTQLSRVPGRTRLKGRFSIMHSERKNTPQFLPKVLIDEGSSLEVSDDQVIAQAIKALHVGPLHSHQVRERPKTVPEHYEQFTKFSKSEIQDFRKLEQQRKVSKPNEAPRLCSNENQRSYPKPIHDIDSDGCGPPENWEKFWNTPTGRTSENFRQKIPTRQPKRRSTES